MGELEVYVPGVVKVCHIGQRWVWADDQDKKMDTY